MLNIFRAARTGWRDGREQPHYLSVGMTYEQRWRQYAYDQASIFGQRIGRVIEAWRRGEGQ